MFWVQLRSIEASLDAPTDAPVDAPSGSVSMSEFAAMFKGSG